MLFWTRSVLAQGDRHYASKLLRHLPRIDHQVFRCMAAAKQAVTVPFLTDVLADERSPREGVRRTLYDTLRMLRLFDRPSPRLTSLEQLENLHDHLSRELDPRLYTRDSAPIEFPPPPFLPAADSGIEPIRTLGELYDEGREQHNCCLSYAGEIAEGWYYIYRVTSPVRATLGIARGPSGWQPAQLTLDGNAIPEESVQKRLYAQVFTSPA
jgi:hypothetical protein